MALPEVFRRFFGFALSLVHVTDRHEANKVRKGFGGGGGLEVV